MENPKKYTINSYQQGVKSCVFTTIGIQSHVPRKMADCTTANSFERLLNKMEDYFGDFNRKLDQMIDMVTYIHHQQQIREYTQFQPQIAAGLGVKNQSFSSSYDLLTPTFESPHSQSSPFVSVLPLLENYPPPPPTVSSLQKVFANETNDVEETIPGMTEHKVFDEIPFSEIVVCEVESMGFVVGGKCVESDVDATEGNVKEVVVKENENDDVVIKFWSRKEVRNSANVTGLFDNNVPIVDEWKLFDKMPLRKIEFAIDRGKKRCLDDEDSSNNMDVIKSQQVSSCLIEKVVVHPFVLLSIVDHYNRVVRDTRNVVLDEFGSPKVVNDGVTITGAIELPSAMENASGAVIREVGSTINYSAGDGTTMAYVLAHEIIKLGLFSVTIGANPVAIKNIEKIVQVLFDELEGKARLAKGRDEIKVVTSISSGNDENIGTMITDAIHKVIPDGVLSIESSSSFETTVDVEEGMEIDRGNICPHFVTNPENLSVEFENARVLVTDLKISTIEDIILLLEETTKIRAPLFIVDEDINGEMLATLVRNKLRGIQNVAAIKAPGFGERRITLLQDMAILTGAEYQATDLGLLVEDTGIYQLGVARKKLADRVAKLSSVVAVIKVGVATETDTRFSTVMVVIARLIKDVQVNSDLDVLREIICSLNLASRVRRVEHGPAWREIKLLKYNQQTKQDEKETKKLQDILQALQFRLATREYICRNIQVRLYDLENQKTEGKKKTEIDPGGLDMNVIHLIVMADVGGCSIRSYYQNTVNCYEGWKMTNYGVEELDVWDDPGDATMIKCFEKKISDTIVICDLGGDSFFVLKFEVTRGQGDVTNEAQIERQVSIESVYYVGRVEFADKTFSRLFFMLLKQRKIVKVEVSIKKLSGKEKVAEVMGNLDLTAQGSSEPETGWLDLFNSHYRNVVSAGAGLFLFQQLVGLNAIVYYFTSIFPSTGITSDVATSVLVGAANVFGMSVSSSLMVKQGLHGLFLTSFAGSDTLMMLFSLSINRRTLKPYSDTLVVLETVPCVLSFSFGVGPVSSQLFPKIFASRIQAKAVVLFPRSNVDPWGQGSKIGGSNVMYTQLVNGGEEVDVMTRIQKGENMALSGLVYEIGNSISATGHFCCWAALVN